MKYCDYCLKNVNCDLKEREKIVEYENKKIKYLEKYYVCKECGKDFYDDLYDYNIMTINNMFRIQNDIITIEEIEKITKKYAIGKKPLSLVLGLGEVTITRYLDGQNPTKENSILLKGILDNPFLYEMYLEVNKDKISPIAYRKTLGKAKQEELSSNNSKLYNVALYTISKVNELDQLSLQKFIYFCNGLYKALFKKNLVNALPEAWKYGPVYRDIYDCFSYYEYKRINYDELVRNRDFDLSEEEKKFIDKTIEYFVCYSGPILREMTHLTDPWINARKGLQSFDSSNRIITQEDIDKYFNKILIDYDIKDISDIEKYSNNLFDKAKNNLFGKK